MENDWVLSNLYMSIRVTASKCIYSLGYDIM